MTSADYVYKAQTSDEDLSLLTWWVTIGLFLLVPLGVLTLILGFAVDWTTAWHWDAKLAGAYWALFLVVGFIKLCGPLRRLLGATFRGIGKLLGWVFTGSVMVIAVALIIIVPLATVGLAVGGLAFVGKGIGWVASSWSEGVSDLGPEPEPEAPDPVCLDWKGDGKLVCFDPETQTALPGYMP